MISKQQVLDAMRVFARQRSGIEYGNYGDWQAFQSERREITRDLAHVNRLLQAVAWRDSIGVEQLMAAQRAFSGRLKLEELPGNRLGIDYCTGQYFPTEYRKAVAAVLASALWDWQRESMPAPLTKEGPEHSTTTYYDSKTHEAVSAGEWLRRQFRREFGPAIARRYFN